MVTNSHILSNQAISIDIADKISLALDRFQITML